MKKIVFTSLTVFLLIFISSCDSQAGNPSPTVNSLSYAPASFYSEEELIQILQDPDMASIAGGMEPVAFLRLSQLFPNDEIRYGTNTGLNRIYCSIFVTEEKDRAAAYRFQYDPAYEEMSLPDIMKASKGFGPSPVTVRSESVTNLAPTALRSSTKGEANYQMFTIGGTPVMYSYLKEGNIYNVCFMYKGFYLSFDCIYNGGGAIDLDIPSTSSFVNIIQNLTDPVKAEQELQRLKGIIDTHLETYAE